MKTIESRVFPFPLDGMKVVFIVCSEDWVIKYVLILLDVNFPEAVLIQLKRRSTLLL